METIHTENKLNKKEEQLVFLGASIASGCVPCTKYHLRKGSAFGLTDDEINKSIAHAISIRDLSTRYMESFANKETAESLEEEPREGLKRIDLFVGIAAAYSVNFPSGLEKYLSIARNSELSDSVLNEVIYISKSVTDKARAHVDMTTDKIGKVQQRENKNEDNCCCC